MERDRSVVKLPRIQGADAVVRVKRTGVLADCLGTSSVDKIIPVFHTITVPRPITSILIGASLTNPEMGIKILTQRANISLEDTQRTDEEIDQYMEKCPDDLPVDGDPLDKIDVNIVRSDLAVNLTSVTVLPGTESLPKKEFMVFVSQTFGQALKIVRNYQELRGGDRANPIDLGSFTVEPPKI